MELDWLSKDIDSTSPDGLIRLPNGQEWYKYFLTRWVDRSASPDDLFKWGMQEIHKVLANIQTNQRIRV